VAEGRGQPFGLLAFLAPHSARDLVRPYVAYQSLQIGRLKVTANVAMLALYADKLAGVMRF
jgi:hypothetical protein